MIRITIENPSDHDYNELQAVIHYLQKVADLDKTSTAPILRAVPEAPSPTMPVDMVAQQAAAAELTEMLAAADVPPTDSIPKPPTPSIYAESDAAAVAPPPPPPAAPEAPAAPTGVELDANGLPWDARIHAGNRAKVADGSWRRRRGVEAELVATVEAELRALMSAPGADQLTDPVRPMTAPEASGYVAFPAAPEASAPPPPPVPAAPALVGPSEVFRRLTELRDGPGFTDEQLAMALGAVGFKAINDVFKRPDLAGQLLETINGLAGAA